MESDKKGCQELLTRRMLLAVISGITMQFLFVYCFVLLANFNIDYSLWFRATWASVTSFRMWMYLVILAVLTFLQGLLCSKTYLYAPPYYKSRFVKLCASFTAQNLLLCITHIVTSGILVWLYLSLKGGKYNSLTAACNIVYGICLVEEHYFLLLSGLWSGLYFFFKTDSSERRYFRFSIIPQSKFFQVRQRFYAMLPTLIITSFWPTLYYIIAYYSLGSYSRTMLLSVISVQTETEPLNTLSRLFNISLILQLWFYQCAIALITTGMYVLFEIYLTEWIPFNFSSSGMYCSDESELTLTDTLSMNKVPIMQHLGYLDLVTLAQKEKMRRGTLFTLSQPGGHPYNWNCIVQKCIQLLEKFSSDLNAISIKSQEQPFCYSANISTTTAVPTLQKDYVYRMRKLVPDRAQPLAAETEPKEIIHNGWLIQRFIKQKRDAFVAYLFSKSLINYIFGEQEENKIRYVLLNGRLTIWAVEAISSLSVFSLSEDSYGIVQKDVPTIINALLAVKQALDKLQKSTILARKMQTDDKLVKEIFTSLRSATKRSLYRIVTNFEPYISDLALESAVIEQLQSFLNYKE